jgi:probable HAF family extracellular repeat protein
MTDLGTLGGTHSWAVDINPAGQIVGYSYLPGNRTLRAFVYEKGTMTDLGTFGGHSLALGINPAGRAVGYSFVAGGVRPVLWRLR